MADAGLDYYNHNLDTSPEFYGKIISTRTYKDRLDTLDNVRGAGIKVCSGGIVGMGEQQHDRAELPRQLANLPVHPERSEEHTSELQSLMRISYAVFCLKKKKNEQTNCTTSPINTPTNAQSACTRPR